MKMFNDISGDLTFTSELSSDFPDKMLPTLDINIWIDEHQRVRYIHYQKPMGGRLCLQKQSALGEQLKKSVLVAEVSRRLQNCDQYTEVWEKVVVLNAFDGKLQRSGYNRVERRRIVSDGYIGYQRRIARCLELGKPTHRNG